MHYSNPGFTMLGELVRALSGVPYEQYVLDNLAAPLNLQHKIFADPGHRKDARGPTLAGLRAYLINADHPYRYIPAGKTSPIETPRFGTKPLPIVKGLRKDGSMEWSSNTGPSDASAPKYASSGRYSGSSYIGGAPLAAGGWYADGGSIEILIRALCQTTVLRTNAKPSTRLSPTEHDARLDWSGACSETVPWPQFDAGDIPNIGCCCRSSVPSQ